MATKPKVLPIPSAATPDNPNAEAIPLSQYLDASQTAPPYTSLPAATGPEHIPVPPALLPPALTPALTDPNAGAIPLDLPHPNAGAIDLSVVPGLYTPEQIKSTDAAALVADKNFRPVDWLADAGQNALADPKLMEKVQDVYTQKLKTDKGALYDLVQLPLHPIKTAKSGIEVGKALVGAAAEIPAVIGRAAGRASTGDFQGAAGEVAAAAQALGSSERRDVNLLLKTLRGVKEKTGFGPETPEDYKKRLFFDLEMKNQENEARAGNGELSRALGVDTNSLKEAGITVNPDAIEKLSILEDPINFIPVGSAVGAVGRFGKMVIAATTSAERAEQLAAVLNSAARYAGTKPVSIAGSLVDLGGRGIEKLGIGAGKLTAPIEALPASIIGHAFGPKGAGIALAAKATPKVIESIGKGIRIVGKGIRETAPVTGVIAAEGLKGAAEAAAITFPLTIGATPEEREALLGNVGLAAGLRAGGTAVRLGGRAAANWTRDKVAADIYKSVERAPTPESPSYGTDPDLDVAHDKQMQDTGSATKNVVNYFREFLRPSGIEIYAMDKNDFVKNVDPVGGAAKAKGYYVKRGVRVNPDGTQAPVNQIFLNGSADAIGHELFHAFEDLDPNGAAQLKTAIAKEWTPQEMKEWKQTYESALNGGKQEKDWTHHLTDEELRSEAAAEVFGRVLDATDLTGVAPTIQQRASRFLSGVLEKIGFPLGGTKQAAGPGVSELGVRATTKQLDVAKDFISNLTSRVKETGSAIGTPKPAVPLTEVVPGEISRKAPPLEPPPAAPPAPGPAPAPAPAPAPTIPITVAPKTPAPPQLELGLGPTASNIRVPASKQLDFAAKRAAVTNEVEAKAAADRLGSPEVQKVVNDVNTGIDAGLTAFEVEHKGVKSASTPDKPLARTPRRTEQEEAYVAESLGAVPEDVRASHQKVSSFVRWDVLKDGTPQFIGYSLDKAIANIEHLIRWSNEKGVEVPYSATPESWREVVQDLTDYYNNQANGFRGDGQRFVRPTEDIQVSLPPENPGYSPVQLSTAKVQFLNAAQGLPAPLTVREVKGKIPANVKAQLLNELQSGKPQAAILPEDIKKREFKTPVGGRKFAIAEVNPLRAEMVKADVPIRELIEVTERLNADDIVSVTPRPDIAVKPGVTDIIRSGFLPSKPATETVAEVLKATPEEWKQFFGPGNSLTRSAYEVGLGLKTPEELAALRAAQDKASIDFRDSMEKAKTGDPGAMDAAYAAAGKSQFFREAIEAATDTGSAAGTRGWRDAFPNAKPPFAGQGKFSPSPAPSEDVRTLAAVYAKSRGLDYAPKQDYAPLNIPMVKKIADAYEAAKHNPADPAVKASYEALAKETVDQYHSIADAGYKIEPFEGTGEPYKNSGEMLTDVRDNKHLYFLRTGEALTTEGKNLMLEPSGVSINGQELPINDVFRAVHDFYGHAKEGYTFGPRGEYNAWRAHDELYSPEARGALASETLGQNAWVNYGEHLRNAAGEVPAKGETGYKPLTERPFAPQKNVLLPDSLLEAARRGQFSPSSEELKLDVKRRLEDKKKAGVPITDIVKRQAQQEAEFDVRRKGLQPGEAVGFFSPRKRETEAQAKKRVEETDYSKYDVPAAAKPTTDKPTGWVLPDGTYVPIDTAYHEQWLGKNAEQLNKKFKTNFNAEATAEDRLAALNAGFVRARETAGGQLVIETNQNFYKGKQKRAIEKILDERADNLNGVTISLLNNEGQVTDSGSTRLFDSNDPRQAIDDMLDKLNPAQTTGEKGPSAIQRARALGGSYLPAAGTSEFNNYVKERIRESKRFPEALPLQFRQDENGDYKAGFNDEPLMVGQDYDLLGTPLAKESKGKTAAETEEKYTSALAKRIEKGYKEAKKNPDIAAGETWYSTVRDKLTNLLGDDSKFFSELLGATSAQTSVDVNFGSAVEAYNQFKRGAFDDLIEKYREGKKAFANGELAEFEKETGKSGKKATYDAFMSWWVEKNQLIPTKSNGKRFEMNSRAVMRVLDGSWLQQVKGPKTPNFVGNLTGSTFEATIDVWAMRRLHRLSNEGNTKRWRIQPANEMGVSDIDFFLGQKAFRKAAKTLGVQPDALQAILWFAEKDHWEKNGWTKAGVSSKKSDYNTLLNETVKTSEGNLEKIDNQLKLGTL